MKELNAVERIAKMNADNFEILSQVRTKDILAIAEAFRALEQRALAAESDIELGMQLIKRLERQVLGYQAQLDELAKQEGVWQWRSSEGWKDVDVNIAKEMEKAGLTVRQLFTRASPAVSLAELVPDHDKHLRELYDAQEKRLFTLAQRIKGPAFDEYAYSPSRAIDVLEAAIFGEKAEEGGSVTLRNIEDAE